MVILNALTLFSPALHFEAKLGSMVAPAFTTASVKWVSCFIACWVRGDMQALQWETRHCQAVTLPLNSVAFR